MTPMRQPASYDVSMVLWLSLAQLITWGSVFYTFALLLEPVEQALGLTRAQTSLGFSLALLTEGLLAYPVGRLIDRGHERGVMALGSGVVGLGLLAHSTVQSLSGFYGVWALLGAGLSATLYPPVFAVVTRRFAHDFRRAIITLTFLGGLASTVFIPLSHALIVALGWRHALWVLAGLQFLVCLPLHAYWLRGAPGAGPANAGAAQTLKPTPAQQPLDAAPRARADSPPRAPADGSTDMPLDRPSGATGRLAHLLLSGRFLLVGSFVVLLMGVTAALPAHLVSLLRENHLPEFWVIAVPASIGVIQVLGRALLYVFEHRIDRHHGNWLLPSLVPLGLVMLLLAPLAGQWEVALVLLFVLIYGLGNGLLTIVKGTAMAEYVSRAHVATLNGALGLPMALARAGMPWLLGLLWSPQNGYRLGLWLLLALSTLGVAALVLAQRLALTPQQASGG